MPPVCSMSWRTVGTPEGKEDVPFPNRTGRSSPIPRSLTREAVISGLVREAQSNRVSGRMGIRREWVTALPRRSKRRRSCGIDHAQTNPGVHLRQFAEIAL